MDHSDTRSLSRKALAHFGREIIEGARDWAINDWDRTMDGSIKAPSSLLIHEQIAHLPPEAQDLVKKLIPAIVDTTLHYVMFMFEHPTHHGIRISVTTPDGEICPDLNAISDGLAGDLLAWTEAYSKKRYKTFPEAKIEIPNLDEDGNDS